MKRASVFILATLLAAGPAWAVLGQEQGESGPPSAPERDDEPSFQPPLVPSGSRQAAEADDLEEPSDAAAPQNDRPAPLPERQETDTASAGTLEQRLERLETQLARLVQELAAARDGAAPAAPTYVSRLSQIEDDLELLDRVVSNLSSDLQDLREVTRQHGAAIDSLVGPQSQGGTVAEGPTSREARRPSQGRLVIHNFTPISQPYVINGVERLVPSGTSNYWVPLGSVTVHFRHETPIEIGQTSTPGRKQWRQVGDVYEMEITLR